MNQSGWHHHVRFFELRQVLQHLSTSGLLDQEFNLNVLEIGSGSGLILQALSRLYPNNCYQGFDIPSSFFPIDSSFVSLYDGVNIPLPPSSVDVAFSVHTLEHIDSLDLHFKEISKVLVDGGLYIAVVPTSIWRLLSTLFYYPSAFLIVLNRLFPRNMVNNSSFSSSKSLSASTVFPRRHGSHFNILSEHYFFSKFSWTRRLRKISYNVGLWPLCVFPSNLIYFSHDLFRNFLSLSFRSQLSSLFGSSSIILIYQKTTFKS